MAKSISAEDYKLRNAFERASKRLTDGSHSPDLDKTLAFWTLPVDRRLPLALLGMTLREVVASSFGSLAATPGIGQKKIAMLITLLDRAAQPSVSELIGPEEPSESVEMPSMQVTDSFEPSLLSETTWEQWRDTVRKHRLEQEKLGRLAASLEALPAVIWHTPLSTYLPLRVAEIRNLKTHGEKRVRAVLEVFFGIHQMLGGAQRQSRYAVRLLPRFLPAIEEWLDDVYYRRVIPAPEDVRQGLALPLLNQLEIDAGPTVLHLAEARLGIESDRLSVRTESRRLGVTRARIYQLLDTCSKVAEVRWPEGGFRLALLADRFRKMAPERDTKLFHAVTDLFYPETKMESHQREAVLA